MLNKVKKMYKEWKEVVGLLTFVLVGITAFLLVDTAPVLAMGIVLVAGAVGLASITE